MKNSVNKKAEHANQIALLIIKAMVGVVVLILMALLGYILITGIPNVSWHFLTSPSKDFGAGGGIVNELFNSVYILIITLVISCPLALGAGIYLAEFAKPSFLTNTMRTTIEVLSSLPSIVIGLFGYLVLVIKFQFDFSIISGAFALMFVNIPLLTRNTEESLKAVSHSQREAGWALGLSKWRTILKIILPAAVPGLVTGIILSAGRIFGEAAALIFTAGQSTPVISYANWNPFSSTSFLNPMRPTETLAVHIWKLNTDGITPDATQISSGASAVLIIVILSIILLSRFLGNYLYKKMSGTK
ncbi:phosphate ABC transporter, permease protein PstA [Fructilactobacillus lindneri]|uniref:Phosphate transport system permease protein PstA n=2 Tax=Fructilactobacillus lindneri TaxID=53444 RepID=A0A0R2JSA9_9LACO|nr:phosphate ABC transporter permease PstA [Fructilactobacillus lindneri]ANZ57394.1 phosphate ABC transporter, permease protein PstA [Fructilactobacillus lindneri]ANZ58660.1 phosphate ABC transporter, permease protein PstA [Fructilactobacillus lindneri]KRN80002.1 phosphate ABC superfamily ATP binding cassette transporter, membrane protein [Fructilactobacillus lindneri DSM 20690 = JCM 11027]POG97879.1 phosphate ABC transporter, permease protein PstA [Fructilactobacillus lindneri]POG99211.1 phos